MHPHDSVVAAERATHLLSLRRAATLVVAALLLGCGGGGDNNGTGPAGCSGLGANQVCVDNNFYSPKSLSVASGTTVSWQWAPGGVQHSVTFDDGVTSPTQSSGTFQRAFPTAGTFPYHCVVHGASMSGTVTVGP